MIDLTRLLTFLHVAQSMSFSEAATHLHLTQPAVSYHIKMLEGDLGVKLFERSGGGIELTEAGYMLLPCARKLIREVVGIRQMLEGLESQIVGHLRIACSTTAGKYITPQLSGRFHQRHPGVNITVLNCGITQIVPCLLENKADIGVVSYDACGEGVECREFFNDHVILIVPTDHPWATRQCIEPPELLEIPLIIRESTSGTNRALFVELSKHSIILEDMNIFMEVCNAEAIVKAVEASFGVAFVSRLAAEWALKIGTVIEIPVEGFDLRRKLYLVKPTVHATTRAVEAFWGFVHDPSNADLLRSAEQ